MYLSKKFDKSCFDKYMFSPSINISSFRFPVTFVLFITRFVVSFFPNITHLYTCRSPVEAFTYCGLE